MGYDDFADIFGGSVKNWPSFGFLYNIGSFLKFKVQNGNIFGGIVKFQVLLGMPGIPDMFEVNR